MVEFVHDVLARALVEDKVGFPPLPAALTLALTQVDFVKLLIDHGIAVDAFLTVSRLRRLYSQSVSGPTSHRTIVDDKGRG